MVAVSRSDWVERDVMRLILGALTYENRLAVIVSLVTGLRIGDVLGLRKRQVQAGRFTVTEQKTNKRRAVKLPLELRKQLLSISGPVYVFEGRTSALKTRTRQAVYKDIKRAATAFRVRLNVTPHSARKIYAVEEYRKDMDIRRVQKLLGHASEAVTMIYALADELTDRQKKRTVQ